MTSATLFFNVRRLLVFGRSESIENLETVSAKWNIGWKISGFMFKFWCSDKKLKKISPLKLGWPWVSISNVREPGRHTKIHRGWDLLPACPSNGRLLKHKTKHLYTRPSLEREARKVVSLSTLTGRRIMSWKVCSKLSRLWISTLLSWRRSTTNLKGTRRFWLRSIRLNSDGALATEFEPQSHAKQ